jgi:hypothetical protein
VVSNNHALLAVPSNEASSNQSCALHFFSNSLQGQAVTSGRMASHTYQQRKAAARN